MACLNETFGAQTFQSVLRDAAPGALLYVLPNLWQSFAASTPERMSSRIMLASVSAVSLLRSRSVADT